VRVLDRSLSRLPRPLRTLVDWAVTVSLAGLAILAFQAEVAKPYRIPSASMEPTLHCAQPAAGCKSRSSDRVIANRLVYRFKDPARGDIVVFHAPAAAESATACSAGGTFVKRIVGLPGEAVSMHDGNVYIDGARLRETYLLPAYRGHETGSWPRVPAGSYFVLGDNRAFSCDSRRWGVVPRGSVIGRAEFRYWPPGRVGTA
jgi:signal peptidase I